MSRANGGPAHVARLQNTIAELNDAVKGLRSTNRKVTNDLGARCAKQARQITELHQVLAGLKLERDQLRDQLADSRQTARGFRDALRERRLGS